MEITIGDIVLCQFYFSDLSQSKNRPVLVLKDNLPFDDFIAIPISSQTEKLHVDELLIDPNDFIKGGVPKNSKLIMRKTFVVSKSVVLKHYGRLSLQAMTQVKARFCSYFNCVS